MKSYKMLSIILLCIVGVLQSSSHFFESIHGSGGVFDSDSFFRKNTSSRGETLGKQAEHFHAEHNVNPDDYHHEEHGVTDQDVDMQHDPRWQVEHERELQYLKGGGRDLSGLRLGHIDDGPSEFEGKAIAQPSLDYQSDVFASGGQPMIDDILGRDTGLGITMPHHEVQDISDIQPASEDQRVQDDMKDEEQQDDENQDQSKDEDQYSDNVEVKSDLLVSEPETVSHEIQQSVSQEGKRKEEGVFPGITTEGEFVYKSNEKDFQKKDIFRDDISRYLNPDTQEDLDRHKITDKKKIGDTSSGRWSNLYHVGRAAKSLADHVGIDRLKQGDMSLQDIEGADLSSIKKAKLLKGSQYLAPHTQEALEALYKSRGKELPKKIVGEIVQTDLSKISQKDLDQAHALRQDALDHKEDLETYLYRFKDRFPEMGKKRDDITIFGTQRTRASLRIAQDIMKHPDEVPSVLVLDKLVKELKSLSFTSEMNRIKEILKELDSYPKSKAAESVKLRLDKMLSNSKHRIEFNSKSNKYVVKTYDSVAKKIVYDLAEDPDQSPSKDQINLLVKDLNASKLGTISLKKKEERIKNLLSVIHDMSTFSNATKVLQNILNEQLAPLGKKLAEGGQSNFIIVPLGHKKVTQDSLNTMQETNDFVGNVAPAENISGYDEGGFKSLDIDADDSDLY